MSDYNTYNDLIYFLANEIFTQKEFQKLIENDLVVALNREKSDGRYNNAPKFSLKFDNDEIFFIYFLPVFVYCVW